MTATESRPIPRPAAQAPEPAQFIGKGAFGPGRLYMARWGERPPYSQSRPLLIERLPKSTKKAARQLMASCVSDASTAKTSALVGALKTLSAMARAVRNRSYVLVAASDSDASDLLDAFSTFNRASNASVDVSVSFLSLVGMQNLAVVEVLHCDPAPRHHNVTTNPGGNAAAFLIAPPGCGKSTVAPALAARLGCTRIVDEWRPGLPVQPGALHLSNAPVQGLWQEAQA